ncbi:MAG: hypothetical protein JST66_07365 [Bacteroidetes bacterium]|nr:hypothetical protein [Bacteroidota bacterium]
MMLFKSVLICVIILAGYVILLGNSESDKARFVVRFVSIAYGLLMIPQIVLHVKYMLDNSKYRVEADNGRVRIKRHVAGPLELVIGAEDIVSVTLYGVPAVVEDRTRWFPWDEYYYWIILCKNGECLVVNSVLIDDISTVLSTSITINQRRVKFFCWPPPEVVD